MNREHETHPNSWCNNPDLWPMLTNDNGPLDCVLFSNGLLIERSTGLLVKGSRLGTDCPLCLVPIYTDELTIHYVSRDVGMKARRTMFKICNSTRDRHDQLRDTITMLTYQVWRNHEFSPEGDSLENAIMHLTAALAGFEQRIEAAK